MSAWTNCAIRLKMEKNSTPIWQALPLIHRNLNREFVCAIWAEVLCWFTNGEPRWHSNRVQALSSPSSQDSSSAVGSIKAVIAKLFPRPAQKSDLFKLPG
jgi:hypothetical protein